MDAEPSIPAPPADGNSMSTIECRPRSAARCHRANISFVSYSRCARIAGRRDDERDEPNRHRRNHSRRRASGPCGSGKTVAALNPILGQDNVARFLVGIAGQAPDDFEYRFAQINGRPGVVNYVDGRPQSVATLEIIDGEISSIYIIVNPDKLQRVPPLRPSAEGLRAAAGDSSQD